MKALVLRSEEHTSELQSPCNLVCRLLLEKKKKQNTPPVFPRSTTAASRPRDRRRSLALSTWLLLKRLRSDGRGILLSLCFFFFNDTATTEIYTLSLHDALPIYPNAHNLSDIPPSAISAGVPMVVDTSDSVETVDRNSTRLNSSHLVISYAV